MMSLSSSPDATSPQSGTPDDRSQPRKARQRRVALACQRCKSRKQRCDGARPACSSCGKVGFDCLYIAPQYPGSADRRQYISALEERVAELESSLARNGVSNVGDDHFRIARLVTHDQAEADEGNEVFVAVRDLSLAASGHYVGGTSNIAIGRVLNSVVQSQQSPEHYVRKRGESQTEDPAPKSADTVRQGTVTNFSSMDNTTADRLIQGWRRHIATRYPMLHTPKVMALHVARTTLDNVYDRCVLHLIYAVSGRWIESAGETGYFYSDEHYDVAFQEMGSILKLRNHRTLDYLLLMTLYCTRAPRDPGAWTYVGMAMRLCIELGLHRRQRYKQVSIQSELDKRRFWTTYFLDRDISIAIGRPPSISDHDIDAELPLDIDEATEDEDAVRHLLGRQGRSLPRPSTTLTPFIHRTRLKRIESDIQHVVYRVDRPENVSDAVIPEFLNRLEMWRSQIPSEIQHYTQHADQPYDGSEFYTIHYHRCVRFLLYPQLSKSPPNMHYLRQCADACAGIITDYRRLHQIFPVGFSALSIQSVFLAGLTWIYCAWLAPAGFLNSDNPLTDCQLLLYVITERYPSAKKYRDIFEKVKTAVLGLMHAGKHQPGYPVALDADMQQDCAALGDIWPYGMRSDFSYIISTMTGQEQLAYNQEASMNPGTLDQAAIPYDWPIALGQGMQSSDNIYSNYR